MISLTFMGTASEDSKHIIASPTRGNESIHFVVGQCSLGSILVASSVKGVWQALRKIPPGSTASYSDIAHMIGSPNSVRAVAGACAANSISLAIPCHRIVRSDGHLSGYRWGIERKRTLLAREASA